MPMIALVVEFLFALVFVRALVTYLRSRDTLQRDVMLVFGALAAFFVIDVYRQLFGPLPALLSDVTALMVLAQPYLTLRLTARLRSVPRWLRLTALIGYLGTALPYFLLPQPTPRWWVLPTIAVYGVTGAVAAGLLVAEARGRSGSPRVRLGLAAAGTLLMVLALFILGIGVVAPEVRPVTTVLGRGMTLLAGLAYLFAFMPPNLLRRAWSGATVYQIARDLFYGTEAPPEAIWHRYAEAVRNLIGAEAVVVLAATDDGALSELAVAAKADIELFDGRPGPPGRSAQVEALVAARQPVVAGGVAGSDAPELALAYTRRFGVGKLRAVRLPLPSRRPAALLLLSRYRTLFADDDARVLAEVGGQAAIMADRMAGKAAREQLTRELAASVADLAAVSEAKTTFLATMSHELRTPLNVIIGFSDLMRTGPDHDGQRTVPGEWIDNVLSSAQHLLGLINDMLDLAKIEAGRMELTTRPLDLRAAVAEVVDAVGPLAERKRLRLTTDVGPMGVDADPVRLRQVLENLVSNALKFTPEDGQISVAALTREGEVSISVADTGVGIAPEDLEHVFEEFRQVGDETTRRGGTGLGLALTRRLVEAHGGHIEVSSVVGQGTTFTVHIPVAPAGPVGPPPAPDAADGQDGGVLVIEDDPNSAALLRTYLTSAGYRVRLAGTGESGLALAAEHVPDAVLLDMVLPDISGWDVLDRMGRDPRLGAVPVFIVTLLDNAQGAQALGATEVFVKPVDPGELLRHLAQHVLAAGTFARPARVLIVDDDPASLRLMREALATAIVEVCTVDTAAAALERARQERFDLVITDLIMPGIDGFALVSSLHRDPDTRTTPVLVVTGHDLSRDDQARLSGKVIGVVTKDGELTGALRRRMESLAAAEVVR
jgi:signal transduction histidine kinase/CheY-like chemotaxis protein